MATVDLWPDVDESLVPSSVFLKFLTPERRGQKAPTDWREWLDALFPKHFYHKLGKRHVDFWRWVLSIERDVRPRPFIGVWPRGSGKSTSAEGSAVALGVRGKRKYGLYVRETQDMADKSIGNVAALLESPGVDRFYPEHGQRRVGKHGNARGWRRERLWTAGEFIVDACGLDTAARGLKAEEQRPDFIILDDIDGKHDTIATTAKKLETITHSILPAGSHDVAVLGIQNLIIPNGIFSRLADGSADFLTDRILSGPFPAVEGLKWEWQRDPQSGVKRAVITAGKATWEGQSLEKCQEMIDTIGITAFNKECQHDVNRKGLGLVLRVKPSNRIDLSDDECRELCTRRTAFGGVDFQLARFAFTLWVVKGTGAEKRVIRVDEYFSQFEGLKKRAQLIHEMCEFYGIDRMPIWGDAANPQDIYEMNTHFRDGWDVKGADGKMVRVTSKLRVLGVMNENKARKVAVSRMNDALDRDALLFRNGIEYDWFHGRTSSSDGTAMRGSRLEWEAENWSFPTMKPGEPQDDNPDDDTADGGDMMASARYALMSHWRGAKEPVEYGKYEDDRAHPFDYKERKFKEPKHAIDELEAPTGFRTPRFSSPRPRGIR